MRDAGWRRIIIIIALIFVVVLGAAAAGLLWWRSAHDARSVQSYKSRATSEWNKISGQARSLTATMLKVGSAADLAGVASEASRMQGDVERMAAAVEKIAAPPGYDDVAAREKAALESLKSYLQSLSDISSKGDPSQLNDDKSILEDRARQAQDDVNEFLSSARWLRVSMNSDFYRAAATLQAAFQPADPARQAEAQAVYDAANAFMNADINQHNFDIIWSMISNRLHVGFDYYKITKDKIASDWLKAWGGKQPMGYYVSRFSIAFPSPGHATVRAIAYIDKGAVRIEEIQLVNEGNGWKLDSYPFAGWYGP